MFRACTVNDAANKERSPAHLCLTNLGPRHHNSFATVLPRECKVEATFAAAPKPSFQTPLQQFPPAGGALATHEGVSMRTDSKSATQPSHADVYAADSRFCGL
jgi:hypothetical protein